MAFLHFTPFWKDSNFRRIIHFTCVAIIVIIGALYSYVIYEAVALIFAFLPGSTLEAALWLTKIALQLASLWMPFLVVIMYLNFASKSKLLVVMIIYTVGCVIAIVFSIVALSIISKYTKPGAVRQEYKTLLQNALNTQDRLPSNVVDYAKNKKCCGWFGPIDIGSVIVIPKIKAETNYDLMKDVELCYGGIFKVEKNPNNTVKYVDITDDKLNQGCGKIYKQTFQRNCYVIFISGLVVILVGLLFIFFAWALYRDWHRPKVQNQNQDQANKDQK